MPVNIPMIDLAWEAINALGGRQDQDNSYDQGCVDTVAKCLEIIEGLGGKDPQSLRAAELKTILAR